MNWTPEQTELFKSLWDKLSNRELAAYFGVTKNSVIGKASRMNLRRTIEHKERFWKPPAEKKSVPLPVEAPVEFTEQRHWKLAELTNDQCHWPFNEPGTDDFHFCGREAKYPYCPEHRKKAGRQYVAK